MNNAPLTIPTLQRLPETLLHDGSVRLELEQGVVIFRATVAMQTRIAELLEKQHSGGLSSVEELELTDYEELDDYLSHVNRLIRNLSHQNPEISLAA
jgi:hypothetical protein